LKILDRVNKAERLQGDP